VSSIRKRAPKASSPLVRRVMQANVGKVTSPERILRSALHATGLRFRKDARPERDLRITADVVFRRAKVCIFVDGCFWHGCPRHFATPKTNSRWWEEKIADNAARDRRQTTLVRRRGWRVLRFWEHQILTAEIGKAVSRVQNALS